jgi:hypothetical protein
MFRGMLIRGAVAAANVTALRATAKMKPPTARGQAFNTSGATRLDQGVDAVSFSFHGTSNTLI